MGKISIPDKDALIDEMNRQMKMIEDALSITDIDMDIGCTSETYINMTDENNHEFEYSDWLKFNISLSGTIHRNPIAYKKMIEERVKAIAAAGNAKGENDER